MKGVQVLKLNGKMKRLVFILFYFTAGKLCANERTMTVVVPESDATPLHRAQKGVDGYYCS